MSSLAHYLQQAFARHAAQVLYTDPHSGVDISYPACHEKLELVATAIQRTLGGKRGLALVFAQDNVRYIEAVLTAILADCVPVLGNAALGEAELEQVRTRMRPDVVFTDGGHVVLAQDTPPQPAEDGLIVFTSGTSRRKKAVVHSHHSIIQNASAVTHYLALDASDSTLLLKGLHHVSPWTCQIFNGIDSGLKLLLASGSFNPSFIVRTIRVHEVRYIEVVGTMLKSLCFYLEASGQECREIRKISVNGEHFSCSDYERAMRFFPAASIYYSYGLTECGPRVTALHPGAYLQKKGSAGRSIHADIHLEILAEDRSVLPAGSIGQIAIKSPSRMTRYWGDSAINPQQLHAGYFLSGDMGYLDEEGYLFVSGRVDDMFTRGGENIFPQDIEDVLRELGGIEDCLVYPLQDNDGGSRICAALVLAPEQSPDSAGILRQLAHKLPRQMLPQKIVYLEQIPRTAAGKVDRKALQDGSTTAAVV